jgi:hypothetical protein
MVIPEQTPQEETILRALDAQQARVEQGVTRTHRQPPLRAVVMIGNAAGTRFI